MTGSEAKSTPRRGFFACCDEVDGEEEPELEPEHDDAESYDDDEEEEKVEDWDGEADLGDVGELPFARL